jgi:exodeoxyribonuclease III
MKIISYNLNGIRSAINKGFLDWLVAENADAVCIQEIKLFETELVQPQIEALGYQCFWYPAQKKGYSGVAIFSKKTPVDVAYGCGDEQFDFEGRVIRVQYEDFSLMSIYFPSGSSGDERQDVKFRFLDFFDKFIVELKKTHPNLVICGDYNICHQDIDIHNPKSNKNSSGFLPEEREWIGKFIDSGFTDAFRILNPEPHQYTWWSLRFGAKQKNLGWRIDYQMVSTPIAGRIVASSIQPQLTFSDHCPVIVELRE